MDNERKNPDPNQRVEESNGSAPPKPLSKTREFIEYHLQNDLPNLKAAWVSLCIIVIFALWLAYEIKGTLDEQALKGKDSTIQGLQTRSDNCQKDYEQVQR